MSVESGVFVERAERTKQLSAQDAFGLSCSDAQTPLVRFVVDLAALYLRRRRTPRHDQTEIFASFASEPLQPGTFCHLCVFCC